MARCVFCREDCKEICKECKRIGGRWDDRTD